MVYDHHTEADKQHARAAPSLTPLFVTIDPARDTIGQLKYYSRDFDPRFQWLTGTWEQVEAVTKSYRVYIGKVHMLQ
jgi:protein SCO1